MTPIHHPRTYATAARRAAFVLVAAGLSLAAALPAAGQRRRAQHAFASVPIERPRLLNYEEIDRQTAAAYPPSMRDSGVRYGRVDLTLRISTAGMVDSIVVDTASNPAFAEAALAVAPRMRFTPGTVGGDTVPLWLRWVVLFHLPAQMGGPEDLRYWMPDPARQLRNADEVARQVAALHPPALRESGAAGDVLMMFRVLQHGTVDPASIQMVVATDLALEQPAWRIVAQMRFAPPRDRNGPRRAMVMMPLHFGSTEGNASANPPVPERR